MLKRFLIFAYRPGNPYGGWSDFGGSCDTAEGAKQRVENLRIVAKCSNLVCQVIDQETDWRANSDLMQGK